MTLYVYVPVSLHLHVYLYYMCVYTNVHYLYAHMCPCKHVYVHILQIYTFVRMIRTVYLFLHMAGNQDKLSYMYMYNTTERVIATTRTAKRGHLPVPTGWAQERTGTLTETIRLVLSWFILRSPVGQALQGSAHSNQTLEHCTCTVTLHMLYMCICTCTYTVRAWTRQVLYHCLPWTCLNHVHVHVLYMYISEVVNKMVWMYMYMFTLPVLHLCVCVLLLRVHILLWVSGSSEGTLLLLTHCCCMDALQYNECMCCDLLF